MALSLELPSFPEPNLVLKTDPIGVEEEVLLFPQFLLITFFLNGKFKHLFSRLHQSILGQSYDFRVCLLPRTTQSSQTVLLSWHLLWVAGLRGSVVGE